MFIYESLFIELFLNGKKKMFKVVGVRRSNLNYRIELEGVCGRLLIPVSNVDARINRVWHLISDRTILTRYVLQCGGYISPQRKSVYMYPDEVMYVGEGASIVYVSDSARVRILMGSVTSMSNHSITVKVDWNSTVGYTSKVRNILLKKML